MTRDEILHAPLLDLLFENRNKAYGAYVLRKYYPQRLLVALCSLALVIAGVLYLVVKSSNSTTGILKIEPEEVTVRTYVIPEPQKPVAPPAPAKPQRSAAPAAQQIYTQVHITANPKTTTDVPLQTELTGVAFSNATSDGVPALAAAPVTPTPEAKAPAAPAYVAPQFPGGAAAWASFLSRNLQAPDALEAGEKKTVLVKFLVSEDGSITSFEVVQSGGAAFDKEVMRVLKKMPKWTPALRYGQPAAVSFTQPVTFIAMD